MEKIKAFKDKTWGVFTHSFLQSKDATAEDFNKFIESVDVEKIADQLKELGADFMGVPIMQCTKFMMAPNETYNKITDYKPGEACAKRDFIMDLSNALKSRGINMLLYYTCDGPLRDDKAGKAMDCPPEAVPIGGGKWNDCHVTDKFVENWTSVLKEYAVRYGDRAFAWWFDGAFAFEKTDLFTDYAPPFYYGDDKDILLQKYKDAVKAGNPEAVVAFNGGVRRPISSSTSVDDFTAGEEWRATQIPDGPICGGKQWFQFICGYYWFTEDVCADGEYLLTPEFMLDYTQKIADNGGVVMYDVQIKNSEILKPQFEILSALKDLKKS